MTKTVLLGKLTDIELFLQDNDRELYRWFDCRKYSWEANVEWLYSVSVGDILFLSSNISGMYQQEIDYLANWNELIFYYCKYINNNVELAIQGYVNETISSRRQASY